MPYKNPDEIGNDWFGYDPYKYSGQVNDANEWLRQSRLLEAQGELPAQRYARQSQRAQDQIDRWTREGGPMPWEDKSALPGYRTQKGVPIADVRPGPPPDINRPAEPWEAPGFTPAAGFGSDAGALPTQRGWMPPGPTQSDPDMMAGMQDPILARINKAIGTGQTVPATGNTGPVGGHILGLLSYLLGQAPKLPGILQQSSVPNPQWLLDPKFWQGYQRNVVGPNNGQY